jgi:hypothetical protein
MTEVAADVAGCGVGDVAGCGVDDVVGVAGDVAVHCVYCSADALVLAGVVDAVVEEVAALAVFADDAAAEQANWSAVVAVAGEEVTVEVHGIGLMCRLMAVAEGALVAVVEKMLGTGDQVAALTDPTAQKAMKPMMMVAKDWLTVQPVAADAVEIVADDDRDDDAVWGWAVLVVAVIVAVEVVMIVVDALLVGVYEV